MKRRVELILGGEEHGGRGSVTFGNDPDFRAVSKTVAGEQHQSVLEGEIVALPVVLVQFSPIAKQMPRQELFNSLVCCFQSADCAFGKCNRSEGNHLLRDSFL